MAGKIFDNKYDIELLGVGGREFIALSSHMEMGAGGWRPEKSSLRILRRSRFRQQREHSRDHRKVCHGGVWWPCACGNNFLMMLAWI